MPSVVIAAHNEENVIGQSLDALLDQRTATPLEIIVSANGCTDRTVEVATRDGVRVVVSPQAGKAAALNAGDLVATRFPRIYLDADIRVPPGGLAAIVECFAATPSPGTALVDGAVPLAAVPKRRLNIGGRPWPVRAFFAINERLPAFRSGLFGRGMIAVSEEGRTRFDAFPELIADDLFIDSQFSESEKAEVTSFEVVIETPFTTRDLVRRLVRVRRGNAQLRAAAAPKATLAGQGALVRPVDRWAWLRDVVVPEPRLAFAAVAYVTITLLASILARRAVQEGHSWGRDESTRSAPASTTTGESS